MAKYDDKEYYALEPEEIRADKVTVRTLCLQQMNRINNLFSYGIANGDEQKQIYIANGIIFGLGALETMFLPELSAEYKAKAEPIKKLLFEPDKKRSVCGDTTRKDMHFFLAETAPNYALKYAMEWFFLMTEAASHTNLYPTKQDTEFIMDNDDINEPDLQAHSQSDL